MTLKAHLLVLSLRAGCLSSPRGTSVFSWARGSSSLGVVSLNAVTGTSLLAILPGLILREPSWQNRLECCELIG